MAQIGEDRVPSTPLNQEDLLGTLGTFTTVTFLALEKLAVSFDDDDRRAFHHLWNVIGWHLGIGDAASIGDIAGGRGRSTWPDDAILPLAVEEMDDLTRRLGRRLQGPTNEGARLAKTLAQELAYPLPSRAHGAPDFLVRYMIGDDHGDDLELGAGGYGQLLVRSSGALEALARRAGMSRIGRFAIPKVSEPIARVRAPWWCPRLVGPAADSASGRWSRTSGACRRAQRYGRRCARDVEHSSVRRGRELPDAEQGLDREVDRSATAHLRARHRRLREGAVTEGTTELRARRGQVSPIRGKQWHDELGAVTDPTGAQPRRRHPTASGTWPPRARCARAGAGSPDDPSDRGALSRSGTASSGRSSRRRSVACSDMPRPRTRRPSTAPRPYRVVEQLFGRRSASDGSSAVAIGTPAHAIDKGQSAASPVPAHGRRASRPGRGRRPSPCRGTR